MEELAKLLLELLDEQKALNFLAFTVSVLFHIIRHIIDWKEIEEYYSTWIEKTELFAKSIKIFPEKSESKASKNDHLITQLLKKKSNGNSITYFSLLIAFIGEYVSYAYTQEISVLWTMRVTVFLLIFSFINQCVLKYRAEHGLYGTCYSEAKEIVSFILELNRENSDSNGGMPKLVFTQEELDQCLQVSGSEEYAG